MVSESTTTDVNACTFDGGTPITATVKTFCRLSALGKTKVFEMIADGTLDTVKVGNRRLIVVASYHRLIAAQTRQPETVHLTPTQQGVMRRALRASTRLLP